jgi:hypothetical protein
MQLAPKPLCAECEIPDAKILSLITRESYCGKACCVEGHLKHYRWIQRQRAEAAHEAL